MVHSNDDQASLNLKLSSDLVLANMEIARMSAHFAIVTKKLADELILANDEIAFQSEEMGKRSAELIIADAEKVKRSAELIIADAEKAKQAAELVIANAGALNDQLTKLPNRRLFTDRFNQVFLSSKRSKTYSALLFLDLDHLKAINDNYGHAAGDLLLIEVSKRVKKSIRDTDTVARFGGDEFAVLLGNLDADIKVATSEVESIAIKIRDSIAMPVTIEHGGDELVIEPQCTVSIGVSLFLYSVREENTILEKVLNLSDTAMYQAKREGGNRIKIDKVML